MRRKFYTLESIDIVSSKRGLLKEALLINPLTAKERIERLCHEAQKKAIAHLLQEGVSKSAIPFFIRNMGIQPLRGKTVAGVHASLTKCGIKVCA